MAPTQSAEFKKAAIDIKKCSVDPNNNDKLELYGLFKVATGEVPNEPESRFDFTGKEKKKAYEKVKELGPAKAQQEYVKLVEKLKPKYKYDPNNVPKER